MEAKLYSNASNARRAARAAFPEGNFEVFPEDGKFGFRGLEIAITSDGEVLVADATVELVHAAQALNDAHLTSEPVVTVENETALEITETVQVVLNPFGSLIGQVTGETTLPQPTNIGTTSRKHTLRDTDGSCPFCNADASSVTYADDNVDDDRRECHECGKRFNAVTGQEIRFGYKKETVARGHKIQKDRPEQNGVKQPSEGTQCRAVWDKCSELGNPSAKDMRKVSEDMGWNTNNTLIEFYQWRKFNGVKAGAK